MLPLAIAAGTSILGGLLGKQKAPKVAPYQDMDWGKAFKDSFGSFDQALSNKGKVSAVNSADQSEVLALMEQALPGFSSLRDRFMADVVTGLDEADSGRLPAGVEANLKRLAAERGVTRGTKGQFNDFDVLRDFGINSMEYAQMRRASALQTLSQITGLTPRINPVGIQSFLVTPQQAASVQQQDNANRFSAQQANNNAQAAAKNANASMWGGLIANAGMMFAGNMMAGGGAPAGQNVLLGGGSPTGTYYGGVQVGSGANFGR